MLETVLAALLTQAALVLATHLVRWFQAQFVTPAV